MCRQRSVPRVVIILATLVLATQSGAFVRDTHYGVTVALALNQERLEVFVEDYLKSNPANHVPDDFEAGREGSFPPAVSSKYDRDGNLLNDLAAARAEARGEGVSIVQDGDNLIRVLQVRPLKKGWNVRVEVKNVGGASATPGVLNFVASNLETGEELGSVEKPVLASDSGDRIEIDA